MVSERYARAYKEVIEVLKHTKREDVNKIPKYKVILWRVNMKKDYDFKLSENKPIEEQNISNEAKAIIANIFKKYWATDAQREKIEEKEKQEIEQIEQSKFGLEDLEKAFKRNELSHETENNNGVTIIQEKESFLTKILKRVKNIFRIK